MSTFFIYDYISAINAVSRERIAIVFCPQAVVDDGSIWESLKHFTNRRMTPDRIILLGNKLIANHLQDLIKEAEFAAKLKSITRTVNTPAAEVLYFEEDGRIKRAENSYEIPEDLKRQIKYQGLMAIFRRRNGILGGPPSTYHFAKPSGAHCNQFIRTANVLIDGAEVLFIASWLLPHLNSGTTHIYCDTSSIDGVAYALVNLRKTLDNRFVCPIIDSFSSYDGLNNGFQFIGRDKSLFLISASTSGDLVKKMQAKPHYVPVKSIVTLFSIGPHPEESVILCDLTKDPQSNPHGYEAIINYNERECKLCNDGSSVVTIVGDQFLPSELTIDEHIITKKDVPQWLNEFLKQIVGETAVPSNHKVIRCHYDEAGTGFNGSPRGTRNIYLDISFMIGKGFEDFESRFPVAAGQFDKILRQSLPASLERIIHLGDKASTLIAEVIAQRFAEYNNSKQITLIPADKVRIETPDKSSSGACLVVASSVASGRSLLGISQAIRNIQPVGAITYFVAVARARTKKAFNEIRSNITYGPYGPEDYGFHFLRQLSLPEDPPRQNSTWNEEIDFLRSLKVFCIENDLLTDGRSPAIDQRIDELITATHPDVGGLIHNLFWPEPRSLQQLHLRNNTAFFNFDERIDCVSQAVVFFLISSVLHSLREGTEGDAKLVHHEHRKVVLSPRCFDRFNDGVIQAALLRAARRGEIDYSISPEYSKNMKEILTCIFTNVDNEQGEATIEFLLSLAQNRLRLRPDDTLNVIYHLQSRSHDLQLDQPIIDYLCQYIRSMLQ